MQFNQRMSEVREKRGSERGGGIMPAPQYRNPPPKPPDLAKQSARKLGQKKFQGCDCIRNHGGLRYANSGQCVQCVGLYNEGRMK